MLTLLVFACISGIQAVSVYLSPPRTYLKSTLSPEDASAALSQHLGLEAFEPLRAFVYQEEFVGQGEKNAVVVTVEESNANRMYFQCPAHFSQLNVILPVILPDSLGLAFTLEMPSSTPVHSLSSVVSTYLHRASHSFTSVFPNRQFCAPDDVRNLVSFFDTAEEPAFAAIDLSSLRLSQAKEELSDIAHELRSFLAQIAQDDRYNLAILTYATPSSTSFAKRHENLEGQEPLPSTAPPQLPIGGISTCFASLNACNDGTTSCSGRGQCVKASKAGRTCFVCTCGVTKTGEGKDLKTEYWAGEKCERKDISRYYSCRQLLVSIMTNPYFASEFVLLSGTVLVIVFLIAGSISLLYTIGDQPLPSTLLATAVHAKKE